MIVYKHFFVKKQISQAQYEQLVFWRRLLYRKVITPDPVTDRRILITPNRPQQNKISTKTQQMRDGTITQWPDPNRLIHYARLAAQIRIPGHRLDPKKGSP